MASVTKRQNPNLLFAGIENVRFDQRRFDPSRDDIEHICRFFSLGKLKHFKKDPGLLVAHSNFFVMAETARGRYALKFYPPDEARSLTIEYAVNRLLISRHFATPVMHVGINGKPMLPSNGRLTACFSYIDGVQPWQLIKDPQVIKQLNAVMLSLKHILTESSGRVPFLKQDSLTATVSSLNDASRQAARYENQKLIHAVLTEICRIFQDNQPLFRRQLLHNDTTLTNFLIDKKTAYLLDLSHIREDYALSDLANLVISCLFLDVPAATTRKVVRDYLVQHKMDRNNIVVLNAIVKLGLVRDFLKSLARERSDELCQNSPDFVKSYLFHLSVRKEFIISVLRKMNDPSTFIV